MNRREKKETVQHRVKKKQQKRRKKNSAENQTKFIPDYNTFHFACNLTKWLFICYSKTICFPVFVLVLLGNRQFSCQRWSAEKKSNRQINDSVS